VIVAGIDAGAATTKVVLLDDGDLLAYRVGPTGFDFREAIRSVLGGILTEVNLQEGAVERICATGYGRKTVTCADRTVSEITAHARGVAALIPDADGIIDIGGQDSKVIQVRAGKVQDFLMNDRCAAGTGKFLEYTARALEVPLKDLGDLAQGSTRPVAISSTCTVFAESEVISLRAQGCTREDIAAGLIRGIAERVAVMARQVHLNGRVVFVGGVAKNSGVKAALEKELGLDLVVPPEPQITGALGAAIACME
jgi:predicted CoA-substrate-specific enzyme activase